MGLKMRKCFVYIVLFLTIVTGMAVHAEASSMSVSGNFISLLKTLEGFKAKPYWDHSQWSVGYGTKCPDDKLEEYKTKGISQEAAVALLNKELDGCEYNVNSFASKHSLKLKQHQFDALVSFTYNCGPAWMQETSGYFNSAVRDGDTGNRLVYGMCLYSTAGGEHILINRRLCEADMYINGNYTAHSPSKSLKWVFLNGNGGKVRYSICGYDSTKPATVPASFTQIPVGTDAQGNSFVYTLAGWYTADGKKVDKLDDSLTNGQVLYARWNDPRGKEVELPMGEVTGEKVTVTASQLTVYAGPASYYDTVTTVKKGTSLNVTEIYENAWGKTKDGWIRLSDTSYQLPQEEKRVPWFGTVTGTSVNYRTEPVINYDTLSGQKKYGDQVEIVQEYDDGRRVWGQMSDGYWISLEYVSFEKNLDVTVAGIKVLNLPYKRVYNSMQESLQLEGSVLQIRYTDGTVSARSITKDLVTDYKAKDLENTTVTVSFRGHTTTFSMKLNAYTVTFKNWDGTVLSEKKYNYGQTIELPADPVRKGDKTYTYTFQKWDQKVTTCTGDATYTAVYTSAYKEYKITYKNADGQTLRVDTCHYGETLNAPKSPARPVTTGEGATFRGWDKPVTVCTGDAVYLAVFSASTVRCDYNGDYKVSDADAIFLLRNGLFPNNYPIHQSGDVNGDGKTDEADARYLLWHTMFPNKYPLK